MTMAVRPFGIGCGRKLPGFMKYLVLRKDSHGEHPDGHARGESRLLPTLAEIRFVRRQSRQESTAVMIMAQMKLLQRLGYFPMLSDVPFAIIDHIRVALRARPLSGEAISRYDQSGTRIRHQKLLRARLGIQAFDTVDLTWVTGLACEAAQTKTELPDIVNVLIEELVRCRYELPPLATLQRMGTQARNEINETLYRALAGALDDGLASRLDALLIVKADKSGWEELKREPKQPTTRAIASFLKHIEGIRKLADGLPAAPAMLSVSKRA